MTKILTVVCFYFGLMASASAQLFSNNYHTSSNIEKLKIERSRIYSPHLVWHYTHHPSVIYFKGKFIAIFSNGVKGEDDPGQRILISRSADFVNWSAPEILKEPPVHEEIPYTLTPGGIIEAEGKLVVFYTENNLGRSHINLYAISSADGISWTEPVDLKIRLYPSHAPMKLSSGRLIMTGNTNFYYTDDKTALSGWIKSSYSEPEKVYDAKLVEGAILEIKGKSLYTLFRSTGKTYDGFLWQTSSNDSGKSWSTPVKTNFTDNNSKSYLGQLPDGRYYYIGTPDTLHNGKRTPLVLSVSSDGLRYDKNYILADDSYQMRYKGKWKDGEFGYPYAMIHKNMMYVIFSRQKEDLEIVRFPLSDLK